MADNVFLGFEAVHLRCSSQAQKMAHTKASKGDLAESDSATSVKPPVGFLVAASGCLSLVCCMCSPAPAAQDSFNPRRYQCKIMSRFGMTFAPDVRSIPPRGTGIYQIQVTLGTTAAISHPMRSVIYRVPYDVDRRYRYRTVLVLVVSTAFFTWHGRFTGAAST